MIVCTICLTVFHWSSLDLPESTRFRRYLNACPGCLGILNSSSGVPPTGHFRWLKGCLDRIDIGASRRVVAAGTAVAAVTRVSIQLAPAWSEDDEIAALELLTFPEGNGVAAVDWSEDGIPIGRSIAEELVHLKLLESIAEEQRELFSLLLEKLVIPERETEHQISQEGSVVSFTPNKDHCLAKDRSTMAVKDSGRTVYRCFVCRQGYHYYGNLRNHHFLRCHRGVVIERRASMTSFQSSSGCTLAGKDSRECDGALRVTQVGQKPGQAALCRDTTMGLPKRCRSYRATTADVTKMALQWSTKPGKRARRKGRTPGRASKTDIVAAALLQAGIVEPRNVKQPCLTDNTPDRIRATIDFVAAHWKPPPPSDEYYQVTPLKDESSAEKQDVYSVVCDNNLDKVQATIDFVAVHWETSPPSDEHQQMVSLTGNSFVEDKRVDLVAWYAKGRKTEMGRNRHRFKDPNYDQRRFPCHVCPWKSKSFAHQIEHMNVAHDITVAYRCEDCRLCFHIYRDMVDHSRQFRHKGHKRLFISPEEELDGRYDFGAASLSQTERAKPRACTDCGARFKFFNQLCRHKWRAHGIGIAYTCKSCFLQYPAFTELRAHQKATGHKATFRDLVGPSDCKSERSDYPIEIGSAASLVSKPANQRTYKCGACHAPFEKMPEMRLHQSTTLHTGIETGVVSLDGDVVWRKCRPPKNQDRSPDYLPRPFACTVCDRTFSRNYYLVSHLVTHGIRNVHTCLECLLQFPSKSALGRHQSVSKHQGAFQGLQATNAMGDLQTWSALPGMPEHVPGEESALVETGGATCTAVATMLEHVPGEENALVATGGATCTAVATNSSVDLQESPRLYADHFKELAFLDIVSEPQSLVISVPMSVPMNIVDTQESEEAVLLNLDSIPHDGGDIQFGLYDLVAAKNDVFGDMQVDLYDLVAVKNDVFGDANASVPLEHGVGSVDERDKFSCRGHWLQESVDLVE